MVSVALLPARGGTLFCGRFPEGISPCGWEGRGNEGSDWLKVARDGSSSPDTSPLRAQGAEQLHGGCSHLVLKTAMVTALSRGQPWAKRLSCQSPVSLLRDGQEHRPTHGCWGTGATCPGANLPLVLLETMGAKTCPACSCLRLAPWESSGRLLPCRHNNLQHTDCLFPLPKPPFPLASPVSYVPKRTAFFNQ